jgi:glycogen debranching enzyme
MSVTREIGPSERTGIYSVPDNELAIGSTLGGPKAACIIKATGALQVVYSIDIGQALFGTVVLRHYDATSGMHLAQDQSGTFLIHPEHQQHRFGLPPGLSVQETIFIGTGAPSDTGEVDPPGVYLAVEMRNGSADTVQIATYAFADLRGNTGHDVVAEYDEARDALVAWNVSQPDWVRVFGCSDKPTSYETTLDYGQAVAATCPGMLSNKTEAPTDALGVLHHVRTIKPNETAQFYYLMSFGSGRSVAEKNYSACLPADESLQKTQAYYADMLGRAVLMTPNPEVNRGVLWAKANMLRTMVKAPTGWCFVNDPTRSNNSVGRDTAWFAYGGDYFQPDFVRESLLAYVHNQEDCGKVVEYYDIRNGKTADYDLNVNDNTPLLVSALWHHYNTSGDMGFLREVYPAAVKAVRYLLSQRNDQGLVWCTATGTSDWGIIGWRNVITNYRLSGASTEVNSECYAALLTASHMARILENHDESLEFLNAAEALKTAINTHLKNPNNGLYYLNIDVDGYPRSNVTSDLVFPVMFGVADDQTSAAIISRLSDADFWTAAGIRTTPRDAPDYDPDGTNNGPYGLLGGVWLGCSFWFAFAAARYNPDFMDRALSDTFRNFSMDPRRNNTVPGQFSEWLHGETLTNEGMMLSPWDPPRYLWAAMEGVVGLDPSGDGVSLHPRLASEWKWLAVQNLPYRQRRLSYFAVRTPDLNIYANFQPHGSLPYQDYESDISDQVQAGTDSVCALGLRSGERLMLFAGNTTEQTVNTSLKIGVPLSGQYRTRLYESLLGEWIDRGLLPAAQLQHGHVLRIERKGFCLLELTQEV